MDKITNLQKIFLINLDNISHITKYFKENEIIGDINLVDKEIIFKAKHKKEKFSIDVKKIIKSKHIYKKKNDKSLEYLTSINKIGFLKKEYENIEIENEIKIKKQVNIITKDNNDLKLTNGIISLLVGEDTIKTHKMEIEDVKNEIFLKFSKKNVMTMDEINKEMKQPESYLITILNDMCYKRKEKNRFVFYLKQIYTTYNDTEYQRLFKNK